MIAIRKPLDEIEDVMVRDLGIPDTVKYVVADTTSEIWEIQPGLFEGLTIVILERVKEAEPS